MALADFTAYKNGLITAQMRRRYKSLSVVQFTGGLWISAWKQPPDAAGNPGTAASNLDGSTTGALFQAIAASGTPRLAQVEGTLGGLPGVCMLADRLAHVSGFSGVSPVGTSNTVGIGPNSRVGSPYANVMAAVEIYSQVGTSQTTLTASYTNEAGTASRTTPAIFFGGTNNREQQRFLILPLQEGDSAVKSVESVTIAASTGTIANWGVTLFRPLALFGTNARGFNFLWDGMLGGCGNLPDVTNACPFIIYFGTGATGGDALLDMRFLDT
jgi:hypothetical protein